MFSYNFALGCMRSIFLIQVIGLAAVSNVELSKNFYLLWEHLRIYRLHPRHLTMCVSYHYEFSTGFDSMLNPPHLFIPISML